MSRDRYLQRWIETPIKNYLRQFPVVGLTGPRQSGKSTTLQHLLGSTYRYVSFDSPAARDRAVQDPEFFLDEMGPRAILDEIQYEPSILHYIKIRVDRKRHVSGQYVVTGSQQFQLIRNLTETLAGRIGLLNLLPFALQEAAESKGAKAASSERWLSDGLLRGTFPELVARPGIDRSGWFESYINTYLERDVRGLYQIGHLRDFRRFLVMLASRSSQTFNMSTYASEIGVSVPTIKQWASVLEASWMIYLLPPFYENFGKRIVKSPKIYFLEPALAAHLVGVETRKHLFHGPMAGALFENLVVSETIKHYRHRAKIPRLYYWRTGAGLEIDLILEKAGKLYPVECKLSKTPRQAMAAPIERFLAALPKPKAGKGKVVTLAEDSHGLTRSVEAVTLRDYLSHL